ncbi:MAG TPA: TonB-dependent receptor [Bacteroidales bacterium]|nr:TonB-dependent receptor [Bacteroidales bacterium]
MKKASLKNEAGKRGILILILLTIISLLNGQTNQKYSISGRLHDGKSEPVPFATVALRRLTDSVFINGTSSDIDGNFSIGAVPAGKYRLQISNLGFEHSSLDIDLEENFNAGDILLKEKTAILKEVVVAGERVKAVKEAEKTTYLISEKMHRISGTGTDLLSYIPGIGVDLMKNISLNGKTNIVIMVDGIERDKNYIGQLSPGMIDRVELTSSAGAGLDASISGAVNIILKKSAGRGLSGHIYAEAPLSGSVYSFPGYSLNYKKGKLELYTSYNGAMSYFDIVESEARSFGQSRSGSTQFLRQKDWSHRFHTGADLKINDRNQVNLYGYANPYSREFDGRTEYQRVDESGRETNLAYDKDDIDRNNSYFASIYYRHTSAKPGSQMSAELNLSRLIAENSTVFSNNDISGETLNHINSVRPFQRSGSFRADYIYPAGNFKLEAGIKARLQKLQDRNQETFSYDEKVLAGYSAIILNISGHTIRAGLRSEYSVSGSGTTGENRELIFLPRLGVNLKITPKQNLELSYNSTVSRPNIYQLNPYSSYNDPDGVLKGNPGIRQETTSNSILNYSVQKGDNFISGGLFFTKVSNAINQYFIVSDSSIFETGTANLGTAYGYGIQFNSALKINRWLTVNNSIRVFNVSTSPNALARQYDIPGRHLAAFESGLSAVGSFKHDISVSFRFQYSSPTIRFQSDYFSGALWFVSADKTIRKNLTIGTTAALPFMKTFTYRGTDIRGEQLSYHSEGVIRLPLTLAMVKIRYQFSSGAKTSGRAGDNEDIISIPKKGM